MATWFPLGGSQPDFDPAVISQVRTLCDRLERPNWMPDPRGWLWRSGPVLQGPALLYYDERHGPGVANLLWLALDMLTPPAEYSMNSNPVMVLLLLLGATAKLDGEPLFDQAAVHTLQEFHDMLPSVTDSGHAVERTYPLLRVLAARRLRHAHT